MSAAREYRQWLSLQAADQKLPGMAANRDGGKPAQPGERYPGVDLQVRQHSVKPAAQNDGKSWAQRGRCPQTGARPNRAGLPAPARLSACFLHQWF